MARYSTKMNQKSKPKQSLLPLWLVLAGIGLFLFAAWAISNSTPTKASVEVKGAARLKVEKDKINHGDVKLGTPIRDSVRVTNVGDQPLQFTSAPYIEVKEGC
jgi:hypothetical protein